MCLKLSKFEGATSQLLKSDTNLEMAFKLLTLEDNDVFTTHQKFGTVGRETCTVLALCVVLLDTVMECVVGRSD